ncbi:S9 family peptidase [Flavihumibacter profundi]|uniref:S9 family peptidase n=1 Tax=Flavihumibacter profundi TaxID=2716883 RepID=UPI001CC396E5|nr:S9 family peptidase [Flavihumibacter profundi]MBZ5858932.1 S9 family peptidase [Flavihumibacter profundi]
MKASLLLLIQLFTLAVMAQSSKDPVKLTDMLKIKQVYGLQLSKDGSKAYFMVTSIEPDAEKKWEYQFQTQIWSVNTDGLSAPKQLTSAKDGASQIALSPDGQQIAFIRSADSKSQLFLLPLNGGEAIQLTKSKYGVSSPKWSPDGKQIVFIGNIPWKDLANDSSLNSRRELPLWATEKPGFTDYSFLNNGRSIADPDGSVAEARAWLQLNEKDKKAKVINRLQFQEESTTTGDIVISQVFIIAASPGATARQLTSGFNSYSNPQFISNSKLLVEGEADETILPDRNEAVALYTLKTDGTNPVKFLSAKDSSYYGAAISPSGKWISFQYAPVDSTAVPDLAIIPSNGTQKDIIKIPLDRSKSNLVWKGDECLYGVAQSNGGAILFQYDLKSKKLITLGSTDEGISSPVITGNQMAYVKTTVNNPFEVYTNNVAGKNEKRISGFNEEWLTGRSIAQPVKYSFVNKKGLTIEYWVMKPTNYIPGKKYPLLLEIHGGPKAMWGPGESTMWHEFQFWCSKGYGVVYCNPRGSGGYGSSFLKSNFKDWGKGPMEDVLHALDNTVEEGWADSSHLFVTGGSYAGYLVAYIIGHDQRFKAACSQRGVYDLNTFFGEGNAWKLVPEYFGGYPWDRSTKEILDCESPISYVKNINTPLIIFHGENDLRTGVIGSEELYKSLKVLGRPVEYVRQPNATHEITRSGNNRQRLDQLLRTWEYFERFR